MYKYLAFFSLLLLLGCNKSDKTLIMDRFSENKTEYILHPGKKLMETNCYVCHNPTTSPNERIAPPMIMIKEHYKTGNVTKEKFILDIQNWIKKPSEENSKMPGAIRNFGLMPYTPYPEETIAQIADYMFENEIEQPDWIEEHRGKGNGQGMGRGQGHGMGRGQGMRMMRQNQPDKADINYQDLGMQYALSTKAELGKNLMGTIQKKGAVEAVAFCNEKALSLTDSMAIFHNANIKRVSDKPRNQNNKANKTELTHIATFKSVLEDKQEVQPILEETNETVKFYYPITTNSMCLQCHGKPEEQIEPETMEMISRLYPKDKAIGYDVNQVRGIWSITFNK